MRKTLLLGPYSRTIPRVLWWSVRFVAHRCEIRAHNRLFQVQDLSLAEAYPLLAAEGEGGGWGWGWEPDFAGGQKAAVQEELLTVKQTHVNLTIVCQLGTVCQLENSLSTRLRQSENLEGGATRESRGSCSR